MTLFFQIALFTVVILGRIFFALLVAGFAKITYDLLFRDDF